MLIVNSSEMQLRISLRNIWQRTTRRREGNFGIKKSNGSSAT